MKKLIAATAFSLLALSCSDKLTESKVEKLVKECVSKKPAYGTNILETGKVQFLKKETLATYEKLQSKGLLTIDEKPAEHKYSFKYHVITLTDKSKPFVIESNTNTNNTTLTSIRLYTKKIYKVGSIQDIPSMNMAEVKIISNKDDKTPFYDELERDKTDFITKNIMVKKTENKGWVYCD